MRGVAVVDHIDEEHPATKGVNAKDFYSFFVDGKHSELFKALGGKVSDESTGKPNDDDLADLFDHMNTEHPESETESPNSS